MKLLIPLCFILFLYGCQKNNLPKTEHELKTELLNDPLYTRFNQARLVLISGIVHNKWNNLNTRSVRQDLKNAKNLTAIKEIYNKAGVKPGFLNAFNNYAYYHDKIEKKYIVVIKDNPDMFRKVMNQLTKSLPLIDHEKIKKLYVPQKSLVSQ